MNPDIKEIIGKLQSGHVSEAYKKTKLGVVPQEWKPKPISHYLRLVERPIYMEDNSEYELITVRRAFGGVDSRGRFLGKSVLVKTQFAVKEKDFVISKRQVAHGACGIIPEELDNAIVSNEYNVFTARENLDVMFFQYFVQLPKLKRLFYLMSNGVHVEKLLFKTNDWLKQKVCMPSYPEQKKIAEILNTWDKGMELKQKLVNEKIAQKKWLMQQLLMGKQRMHGFRGEWKKLKAREIFKNYTDKQHKGDLVVLSATQDKGVIPRDDVNIKMRFDIDNLSYYKKVCKGDFVISLRSFQGGIEISHYNGIVSPAYTVFTEKIDICKDFYKQFFKNNDFINKLNTAVYGIRDGKQISFLDFSELYLPYPPPPEQTAIAEILSTADQEIDLLEKELAVLRQQKKALMQLLLTGIVRVNA